MKTEEVAARGVRFSIERDGREAARAFLYVLSNSLHERPFGLLEDVFVEESFRSRGLGVKLVRAVIDRAKRYGCYKLIATSRHSRPEVHDLYLRLGFSNWGTEFRMNF